MGGFRVQGSGYGTGVPPVIPVWLGRRDMQGRERPVVTVVFGVEAAAPDTGIVPDRGPEISAGPLCLTRAPQPGLSRTIGRSANHNAAPPNPTSDRASDDRGHLGRT